MGQNCLNIWVSRWTKSLSTCCWSFTVRQDRRDRKKRKTKARERRVRRSARSVCPNTTIRTRNPIRSDGSRVVNAPPTGPRSANVGSIDVKPAPTSVKAPRALRPRRRKLKTNCKSGILFFLFFFYFIFFKIIDTYKLAKI